MQALRDFLRTQVLLTNVLGEEIPPAVVVDDKPPPLLRADDPPIESGMSSSSDELASLVGLSLRRLREILNLPLPHPSVHGYEEVTAMARVHLSATEKVLNTQVRVDDNVLKRRVASTNARLLRELVEHEKHVRLESTVVDVAAS